MVKEEHTMLTNEKFMLLELPFLKEIAVYFMQE